MDLSKWAAGLDSNADFVRPQDSIHGRLVYGPVGQLRYIRMGPGLCTSTAGIVYWDEPFRRFRINPNLSEKKTPDGFPAWGWYDELCAQTNSPEYGEKAKLYYDQLESAKRNNAPRPLTPKRPGPKSEKDPDGMKSGHRPTPPDWYHPVLEARRSNHDGGRPVLEWDAILGIDTSGDVPVVRTSSKGSGLAAFDDVDTTPESE